MEAGQLLGNRGVGIDQSGGGEELRLCKRANGILFHEGAWKIRNTSTIRNKVPFVFSFFFAFCHSVAVRGRAIIGVHSRAQARALARDGAGPAPLPDAIVAGDRAGAPTLPRVPFG